MLRQNKYQPSREIFLVFLLGFVVRLFACHYTFIVNPDGVLYIHQARAIYYGQWESLTSWSMSYLSIYPVFITGAYTIFHDWIVAARSVSVFFGSITLIPLYFLFRRFFDRNISLLSLLVFALIPVLVVRSADVVRGPVYWFFLILGLYYFIIHIDSRRYRLHLVLSCLCFLMAAWARTEAVLPIIGSCFYLLAFKQEKRLRKAVVFVLPVLLVILFVFLSPVFSNIHAKNIFRIHEVADKLSGPIVEYRNLRASLLESANHPPAGVSRFFLGKARNLVWLIALGTLFAYVVKAFFYPFFFIFIVGMAKIRTRIKTDQRLRYLVLLSIAALVLLYFHVLQTWIMANRFLALFIFPCFFLIGFGLENIVGFLRSRFRLKSATAFSIVCLLILCFGLPKNLKPREADKLVFKEIGEFIAEREGNGRGIPVAASLHTVRWISFYANLDYPGAFCPQSYGDFALIVGANYRRFIRNLDRNGMKYFLWEEKHWPKHKFDLMKKQRPKDLIEVGRWTHPDTGLMILFRVV